MSASIIVAASLAVARAILTESALSFMGLGVQLPKSFMGNNATKCTGVYYGSAASCSFSRIVYCADSV